jgi:hypothetical protein
MPKPTRVQNNLNGLLDISSRMVKPSTTLIWTDLSKGVDFY